jgi:hypothetical protein
MQLPLSKFDYSSIGKDASETTIIAVPIIEN